jgi:flavodoxin
VAASNLISRRAAISAPAAKMLAASASATDREATGKRGLVAYFSRSGNTRVIAGQLHRDLGADLFEIQPAVAYPEDYEETVEMARRERDAGKGRPLKVSGPSLGQYGTVFLGFPIWGETTPPVIRAFLDAHDLSGKIVRPFITHGGYGLGNSMSVLGDHAPHARVQEAFAMEADQERRTMNQVRVWLDASQLRDRKS